MITLGTETDIKIYKGSTEINKAYLGTEAVYPNIPYVTLVMTDDSVVKINNLHPLTSGDKILTKNPVLSKDVIDAYVTNANTIKEAYVNRPCVMQYNVFGNHQTSLVKVRYSAGVVYYFSYNADRSPLLNCENLTDFDWNGGGLIRGRNMVGLFKGTKLSLSDPKPYQFTVYTLNASTGVYTVDSIQDVTGDWRVFGNFLGNNKSGSVDAVIPPLWSEMYCHEMFRGAINTLKTITIPANVTKFTTWGMTRDVGNYNYKLDWVKCLATTPPATYGNTGTNYNHFNTIYVPDESVSLYEAATEWNAFTIKPLSELTQQS